eukprot:768090-Hanusia_phi.AAC.1
MQLDEDGDRRQSSGGILGHQQLSARSLLAGSKGKMLKKQTSFIKIKIVTTHLEHTQPFESKEKLEKPEKGARASHRLMCLRYLSARYVKKRKTTTKKTRTPMYSGTSSMCESVVMLQ